MPDVRHSNALPIAQEAPQVVQHSACIGCGACAAAMPELYQIEMNDYGEYQAIGGQQVEPTDTNREAFAQVCPFSGGGPDEDDIGSSLYGDATANEYVGFHRDCYVAWVDKNNYRAAGSSGGMTSWMLAKLLGVGEIDGVIHVKPANSPGERQLFHYAISHTLDEVRAGAKSRYYPVEMSSVLSEVRRSTGRYAFVGVPCFVKAVRRLCLVDPELDARIAYCIAIFCGHLKSRAFAEAIAWELGVEPAELETIDFRHKLYDRPASQYGVKLTSKSGETLEHPMQGLATKNWGLGMFKYLACDLCDDVVGETADISFGDAWLDEYRLDPRGANVVVVRNQRLAELVAQAFQNGEIEGKSLSTKDVYRSQEAGFRHRRPGLAYRLWAREQRGEWSPQKRVQPDAHALPPQRRRIMDVRVQLADRCRAAFVHAKQVGSFQTFLSEIEPLVTAHQRLSRRGLWLRIRRKLSRLAKSFFKSPGDGGGQK